MKISFIIAALILAIAAFFGIDRQARLTNLKVENKDLVNQSEALKIPNGLNESSSPGRAQQLARQQEREDLVDTFLSELKSLINGDGDMESPEMIARGEKIFDAMLDFSALELKMMVEKVVADPALEKEGKQHLITFAVMRLASENPMAGLTIISESKDSDLLDPEMFRPLVGAAVSGLAKEYPVAAADWLRENKDAVGEVGNALMGNVIEQAGLRDFGLALSLINDLESDRGRAFGSLGKIVTPERADDFLNAIRGNPAASEEKLGAFRSLASGKFVHDFEGASKWLAESRLTDDERSAFISNIRYHSIKKNPGEWMAWVNVQEAGSETAKEARRKATRQTLSEWTRNDFVAAGEWVGALPEGESRNEAVMSYAGTLATHEPAAAADWAATLPDGMEKTDVLMSIHRSYKSRSPEEAATFAEKHGLPIHEEPATSDAR